MIVSRSFEIGLNNLYVFEAPQTESPRPVVVSRTAAATTTVTAST
jgi:hypothetical protein